MSVLPGSDKYRVAPPERKLTWEQSVINKANLEIRIEDVLSRYYEIEVPYDAVSWKVRCPYAYEHADGGLDKQFRVYSDSNTGYCFAMHDRVNNIRLYRDKSFYTSTLDCAKALLDDFDIDYRRKSYQEVFNEINLHSQTKYNYLDLVEAMKLYLQSFPEYPDLQYDNTVLKAISNFNAGAKQFCVNAQSLKEVEQWYYLQREKIQTLMSSLTG